VPQRNCERHHDQACKCKIYVHETIARIIGYGAILPMPQENKKFGFMM
jgi:hypothetical protein